MGICTRLTAWLFFIIFSTSLFSNPVSSEENSSAESKTNSPIEVSIHAETTSIQAGHPFWVLLKVDLQNDWHTYWKSPGDGEKGVKIDWDLPENFKVSKVLWPHPVLLDEGPQKFYGYKDAFSILAEITPPADAFPRNSAKIAATIHWLVCSGTECMPGLSSIKLQLPIQEIIPLINSEIKYAFKNTWDKTPQAEEQIDLALNLTETSGLIAMAEKTKDVKEVPVPAAHEFQGGFLLALLFAFVGGSLLNLMPCVLPVVSFKILSFVKMAGQNRYLILKHGLYFAAGVLVSFWLLAGLMLTLQSYGETIGWGFQLQKPLFVAILAAILFLFSLSMFGLFELGTGVASWAAQKADGSAQQTPPFLSSFFSGVLATAVATPCTGPLLGTAVGFAVTLSIPLAMIIFTFLGLGMAFPYVLLSAYPSLMRFLPKPGAWMVTFKEAMGFLMMASALWLVWVFGAQTSSMSLSLLLASFLFFAVSCWVYGKWSLPFKRKRVRRTSYLIALCFLLVGGFILVNAAESNEESLNKEELADDWEAFSLERLSELKAKGIPVFIDFTAKWCLTCQANHLVLGTQNVKQKMTKKGVIKMKADWTKNDPVITEELKKFGRNSVPLYVVYGNGGDPKILPQILTSNIVAEYVDELADSINYR